MKKTDIKRFFVKSRQLWRESFNNIEFEKKDMSILARDMSNTLLNLDIEYRLKVLKDIQTIVVTETKQEVVDLKQQQLLILSKLEEYEEIQTN